MSLQNNTALCVNSGLDIAAVQVQSMRQYWAICNKEKVCKKKIYVKGRDAKKQKTNVVALTRNL
jgi:hypothetical protein